MNSLRIVAAIAFLAFAGAAFAQCGNEAEAAQTAASLKQELATLQQTQQAAMKDFQSQLDRRAEELAWSKEQTAAFLRAASQTAQYAMFELQKQQQLLQVNSVQKELTQPDSRADVLASCKIGLKMAPPMRSIGEVNAKQMQYLVDRLQATTK